MQAVSQAQASSCHAGCASRMCKKLTMVLHAHGTPWRAGFTGADLQNLMNEAAILAARRNLKEISKEEISDALERLIAGPEKKGAVMAEKKRKLVAYHEVIILTTMLLTMQLLMCYGCSASSSTAEWCALLVAYRHSWRCAHLASMQSACALLA